MKYFLPALGVALAAAFPLRAQSEQPETYTYPQLVQRMTDLRLLAKLPPPGEKTYLASSYDRSSKYDAVADKYIAWAANGDNGGAIRQEGPEAVFADFKGPGCVWRTWAATVGDGHVKFYIDGKEAVIDLPFKSFFDGTVAPFNRPNIVYVPSAAAHGYDNYTPIPFQKSCKIVGLKGWGQYYQFTCTQFPDGTVVPTFKMDVSPEDGAALDQADKILGQCGQDPADASPATKTDSLPLTIPAGQSVTLADLSGPGAVTALKVKLDLPGDPEAQRFLLRQLTISITWDDETAPAVWSPLGDFFGYVGGADKFTSLPAGLLDDGTFYSYWYMPYGKKAHIEIGNDGNQTVSMTWQVSHAPLTEPISGLARFHAKWHRDAFLPERADRAPDWTLLTTQGTGRYVGTHLHGWNPRGDWWGEGDDKFFIDGEKFPSIFGTGSEDYFGYAWSSAGHFSRPYHNQILNENNAGHFDDNRWHIPDSVPFQSSIEACIEKYFPNERTTLYAAEAFWYLNEGGTDPYGPVPVADRVGYWTRPVVYMEPHVIEGEWLKWVNTKPIHNPFRQDTYMYGKQWSNDRHLFWRPATVGESVDLGLPPQKAGTYLLKAHYTNGPDLGIFQLGVNGAAVGAPVDLYGPAMATSDVMDVGTVTLPEGASYLTVTLTGKNSSASATNFGLDYIKLVPVP